MAEACTTYVFALILYRLLVLYLSHSLSTQKALDSFLYPLLSVSGGGCLRIPHVMSRRHASRLAFRCRALTDYLVLEGSIRNASPRLTTTPPVSKFPNACPLCYSRFFFMYFSYPLRPYMNTVLHIFLYFAAAYQHSFNIPLFPCSSSIHTRTLSKASHNYSLLLWIFNIWKSLHIKRNAIFSNIYY